MITKVYEDGSHLYLDIPEATAFMIQKMDYYKDKKPPIFHISRERIR